MSSEFICSQINVKTTKDPDKKLLEELADTREIFRKIIEFCSKLSGPVCTPDKIGKIVQVI